MANKIDGADLFSGAGGLSSGLEDACNAAGVKLDLVAVNHWEIAVKTHSQNHPNAKHYCASIDQLDPRKATDRLDILVAAPECVFHSRARGGRPINDQRRASAFHVLRWMELFMPHSVLIENVPEFRDWGPLGANGLPLKSRKGETFNAFIGMIKSLGYKVEYNVLNCANYGDVTTRERLFIIARRGHRKIKFPDPTHSKHGGKDLFNDTLPWRAAKDIIDWNIVGKSIYDRPQPLSPNTLKRIEAGLRKFGTRAFVIQQQSGGAPRLVDLPLPTVAGTGSQQLVTPFILKMNGGQDGYLRASSVDEPFTTITAHPTHALVEPFVLSPEGIHRGNAPRSTDQPLATLTASRTHALVEPFILARRGTDESQINCSVRGIDDPIPTIMGNSNLCVVEPFLTVYHGDGDEGRTGSIDSPLSTLTTFNKHSLVTPFIVGYHGNGANVHSIDEPLPTLTTKDRYALVVPGVGEFLLDIRMRMLEPKEMAAAHGLDDYDWSGTTKTDQKKMIGNSVPRHTAAALCSMLLD